MVGLFTLSSISFNSVPYFHIFKPLCAAFWISSHLSFSLLILFSTESGLLLDSFYLVLFQIH